MNDYDDYDDANNSDKHSNPVTVIVKRISKKDKIKEFEEWFSGISREVFRRDGSMGIDKLAQLIIVNLNLNTS